MFFPLDLLATVPLGAALEGWPVVPRVAVVTLVLTPIMTYLLLPWVTRRLGWWLQVRRWRERRGQPAAGSSGFGPGPRHGSA